MNLVLPLLLESWPGMEPTIPIQQKPFDSKSICDTPELPHTRCYRAVGVYDSPGSILARVTSCNVFIPDLAWSISVDTE